MTERSLWKAIAFGLFRPGFGDRSAAWFCAASSLLSAPLWWLSSKRGRARMAVGDDREVKKTWEIHVRYTFVHVSLLKTTCLHLHLSPLGIRELKWHINLSSKKGVFLHGFAMFHKMVIPGVWTYYRRCLFHIGSQSYWKLEKNCKRSPVQDQNELFWWRSKLCSWAGSTFPGQFWSLWTSK